MCDGQGGDHCGLLTKEVKVEGETHELVYCRWVLMFMDLRITRKFFWETCRAVAEAALNV